MLRCALHSISRGPVNPLCACRAPCFTAQRVPTAWARTLVTTRKIKGGVHCFPQPSHKVKAKVAKVPPPELRKQPSAWVALLEPYLPPHLRDPQAQTGLQVKNPLGIVRILAAARTSPSFKNGLDVLCTLAVEQQRWSAVVWLVKTLVEAYGPASTPSSQKRRFSLWHASPCSLNEFTSRPAAVGFGVYDDVGRKTSPVEYHDLSEAAIFGRRKRHNILGNLWRSIGSMTLACVDGEVKLEILEILAHFHHMGIMPTSIYTFEPTSTATAIQQPQMLNLLSSNILTSLLDAAWRGHARVAAEESRAQGIPYAGLPGTAVRAHFVGLRPEVWLELILWSCIHGGWISDGAAILQQLIREPSPQNWVPLSWTTSAFKLRRYGRDRRSELRALAGDTSVAPGKSFLVRKTISSELVTAYIDGLVSQLYRDKYDKPESLFDFVLQLRDIRRFLQRSEVNLSTGSWNAIILRVIDARGADMEMATFDKLMRLAPVLGSEINTTRHQGNIQYVFDGNAAVLGHWHDALRASINAADLQGAIRLFRALQSHTDENKRRSVVDFIENRASSDKLPDGFDISLFTSNFSGIDFPALHVQIPSNILHDFIELLIDSKEYEFATWLVKNNELNGPIVHESAYSDAVLAPALLRLAIETRDKILLSKVILACTPKEQKDFAMSANLTLALFNAQVSRRRWDAAGQIMEILQESKNFIQITEYVAQLSGVMISLVLEYEAGKEVGKEADPSHLNRARELFKNLIYGMGNSIRPRKTQQEIDTLIIVLATVNDEWLPHYRKLRKSHFQFHLSNRSFNTILEALVNTTGSVAGRGLLGIFWPHKVRSAQLRPPPHDDPLRRVEWQKTMVRVKDNRPIAMYGGFCPDYATIRIILRKAMEELKQQQGQAADKALALEATITLNAQVVETMKESEEDDVDMAQSTFEPSGMIVWAIRSLRMSGMAIGDVKTELGVALSDAEVESFVAEAWPQLYKATNLPANDDVRGDRSSASKPSSMDDENGEAPYLTTGVEEEGEPAPYGSSGVEEHGGGAVSKPVSM